MIRKEFRTLLLTTNVMGCLASRIFLHLAGGRYGDFRDWPAIDAWALEIADQLDGAATMSDAAKTRLAKQDNDRESTGSAP